MFKKAYSLQFTVFLLSFVFCLLSSAESFAQEARQEAQAEDKLSKLMPAQTELLFKKEDKSQQLVVITTYKFGSGDTKEKISEFYRRLFVNEGFSEFQGYSPEKRPPGPAMAYFFAKPNELAMLNTVPLPEDGLTVYYVTLHKPDVRAIKDFNRRAEQYEKE